MMPAALSGTLVVRRNPKLAWREIEGDIVIISPEDSSVHELNETAGLFWRYADGQKDLEEIAASLAAMYDAPMDTIRSDIEELVADLSSKNLLLVSAGRNER